MKFGAGSKAATDAERHIHALCFGSPRPAWVRLNSILHVESNVPTLPDADLVDRFLQVSVGLTNHEVSDQINTESRVNTHTVRHDF